MSIDEARTMQIDLVADMVCPWCYVGWERLKAALALRPDLKANVVWRPFQLDPTLPEHGVDRRAYMMGKFPDAERRKTIQAALTEAAAEDGIVLNLDRIERSPNTLAAHRLIRWSQAAGCQDQVVEGLFRAYFTDGRDIGDPVVLADIAAEAGMDRLAVLDDLSRGTDAETVSGEHQTAVRAGVTGVPFMIFDQKYSVVGAETPVKLLRVIDHTLES